ncbi:formate dehydrogenase subunit delta [Rhizobium sp. NFR07]|uniref:formate dehydrogenase subunit delta n=1 Tax=Rhizobium sp. NFR07 TaxID=1566262 RepID=UPI0008E76CDF|nr:formate dehydrogenase subunit delta [Rhizobium sp. NFR07]SFB24712.1 formate dehydrogenase subunit delta [Rhizobium sp. NFR07]
MSHEAGHNDGHDKGQEKLIRMANQIATFFMSQPEKVRVEGVATHINKFWEPRMRRHLFEHIDSGGEGLMPLVVEASALIKRPLAPAPTSAAGGDTQTAVLATPQN